MYIALECIHYHCVDGISDISLVSTYVVCERLSVMHEPAGVVEILVQILQNTPFNWKKFNPYQCTRSTFEKPSFALQKFDSDSDPPFLVSQPLLHRENFPKPRNLSDDILRSSWWPLRTGLGVRQSLSLSFKFSMSQLVSVDLQFSGWTHRFS